jgi:predicted hotdog family 3-hydroxylacyl-ACP dehydratase
MVALKLDAAGVAALLPHAGAMCLIDGVTAYDERRIACVTARHRDPANPLREDGRLSSLAGIELAAQAMALHGALVAGGGRPMHGWLARVRDCVFQCERMDDLPSPLHIEAERLAGDLRALSYRFTVRAGESVVVGGWALIALAETKL